MKQNLLFNRASALGKRLAMVLTMLLTIGIGTMWGATAEFAPTNFSGQGTSGTGSEISATVSGVTFACDKGYGTTQFRCYSGSTITISSSNTITAISFTFSGSYKGGLETSYTNLNTNSWEQTLSSQARITECVVTYEEASTDPCTVTFHTTATEETELTEESAGDGVTPPTMEKECGDWTFQGWSESYSDSETSTTKLDLVTLDEDIYYPSADVDLYPVYTKTEGGDGSTEETLSQTLQYDTWSYSGSTTNKTSYRLFHSGSYVESSEFDLSTLSKVVVYGGTYGGSSYNKLTIAGVVGTTTTTWKSVTVSGSNQTGTNTYTDGTSLSGIGKLRVISNSGSSSSSGVRISKILIYTLQATSTTYYYSYPQCSTETLLSVTYDANGATSGSVPVDNTEYEKDAQVTVLGNTGTLAKTGYTFSGWNTKADGFGTNYAAGATFTITENTTLYAQWTAYTVTWTINPTAGGSLSATSGNSTTVSPDAAYTYGTPAYTVTSGTATVSQNGNTFTAVPTANCTIQINMVEKPKWTVTFHAGEHGTCATASLTETTAGAGVKLPDVTPNDGYRFIGWATTSGATTANAGTAGETYKPESNITLYAVYKQLHTITWMVGSNSVRTDEVANATGVTQTPADPANDAIGDCANAFMGWSEKSAGSTPQDEAYYDDLCTAEDMKANHTSVTGDKTFYAVFASAEGVSSTDYTKITSDDDLTSGDYVIAYSYNGGTQIVLKNEEKGSKQMKADTLSLSGNVYANPSGAYIWHLEKQTDGIYTCYNSAAGKNLYATTSELQLLGTATKYQIEYDDTNSRWTIKLNSSPNYYVHGYVDGSTYDFRVSTSGDGGKYRVYLYKNTSTVNYSNYVTSCCETPAPTNGNAEVLSGTSVKLTWEGAASSYHITGGNLAADGVNTPATSYTISGLTECETYTFNISAAPDNACESAAISVTATPFEAKTITFEDGSTTTTLSTTCENDEIVVPTPTAQNCSTYVWIDEATGTQYTDGQTITPANDMTIVAKWSVKTYTITFNDWDGTQLQQSTVECGQTPAYNGETPTRPEDKTYKYTFAGWTPSIEEADGHQTYIATYTETQHQITVIWMVNGEVYTEGEPSTVVLAGGQVAKLPTPPSPDDYCGQVFAGWTDQPIDGDPIADAPAVLFNTPETSPTLYKEGDKTTVTFYAVFADLEK